MIRFKRKNPKVLYIDGWPGGTPGDRTFCYLRDMGFDVMELNIDYVHEAPSRVLYRLNKAISENNIELVFGLSTGGLYASCLPGVTRILINPAYDLGTYLLFHPKVDIRQACAIRDLKMKILPNVPTYGFFSMTDETADSKRDFLKIFGKSKCIEINSTHVPRSKDWNEQILPKLKTLTGLSLVPIEKVEVREPIGSRTYATIDGIRLPGMKYFPEAFFWLRLKYLEKFGIHFDNVDIKKKDLP